MFGVIPWKRQRAMILEHIIRDNFHDYDVPSIPTNLVRGSQRKKFTDLPVDQQEEALFDDFLSVCLGVNGPYIQCEQSDNDQIQFVYGADEQRRTAESQNIERWLNVCIEMGQTLFDLLTCIERLRVDSTRGPTVYAFCSLVLKYLERNVYTDLRNLSKLETKNLMTLKSICSDLNHRQLSPLRTITREIFLNDLVGGELINFLFEQKEQTECYHITFFLDSVISETLHRYNQNIFEWISHCSLSSDMAHEFFIWDLRKQNVVRRCDFADVPNSLEESGFENFFVRIPQLLPKVYESVADELVKLGRFLFTLKHQNADMEHLSTHYQLDQSIFEVKGKSLGEFCATIRNFYDKCSMNMLNHLKNRFDILQFARHLPHFFVGLNSGWIYEFVVLLEEKGLSRIILDNECAEGDAMKYDAKLKQLMEEAFRVSWLQNSQFHDKINIRLNERPSDSVYEMEIKNTLYVVPRLELNIVVVMDNASNRNRDSALSLAFPAGVTWSYRQMFYHLLLFNRAKHLMYRKYYALKKSNCSREEFAAVHQFLRVLNVYIEFICGVASSAYPNFSQKLDSVRTLDDLVDVQLKYINQLMEQMMMDQGTELKIDERTVQLKQVLVDLVARFCNYANDIIDFETLNREASPLVGRLKMILLKMQKSPTAFRNLLFGCYFTAIGGTAADEEPIWRLLCNIDDETAFAAAMNT